MKKALIAIIVFTQASLLVGCRPPQTASEAASANEAANRGDDGRNLSLRQRME